MANKTVRITYTSGQVYNYEVGSGVTPEAIKTELEAAITAGDIFYIRGNCLIRILGIEQIQLISI